MFGLEGACCNRDLVGVTQPLRSYFSLWSPSLLGEKNARTGKHSRKGIPEKPTPQRHHLMFFSPLSDYEILLRLEDSASRFQILEPETSHLPSLPSVMAVFSSLYLVQCKEALGE